MTGLIRGARRPAGWAPRPPFPAGAQGDPTLDPADDEDLCFLSGDWRIFQKQQGHRWSLDDLVTAQVASRYVTPTVNASLDMGCGLGSVLMLLAWRHPALHVTGIEAQADRAAMARRSLRFNGAAERCTVLDGDLRDDALLKGDTFSLITGTPPYFPAGTGPESTKTHAAACRFEHRGGVETYLEAAARWLSADGVFVMCAAALEANRVQQGVASTGLHLIEHVDIEPRAGKPVLVTVDVVGRKPTTATHSRLVVRDARGQWTPEFKAVRDDMGMPPTPPKGPSAPSQNTNE